MNKIINLLVCAMLVVFTTTTYAQETRVPTASPTTQIDMSNPTLPSFKTFYRDSNSNYKNDISFEVKSGMVGHLKVEGNKCFIDEQVTAVLNDSQFIIDVTWKARYQKDTAFCSEGKTTVSIPVNSRSGRISTRGATGGDFFGFFSF